MSITKIRNALQLAFKLTFASVGNQIFCTLEVDSEDV